MIATAMAAAAAANTIPAPAPRATIKRRRARVENVAMQREIMAAAADKRARRALRPIPPTALVQR